MESIDILNEQGEIIGIDTRENIHKTGLLHATIHVWIYNSKKEILIQQRSYTKDSYPGLWEILGGHLSSGETPEIAVLKELKEEIGLEVNYSDLEFVNKKFSRDNIPEKEWDDNEINYIYSLRLDIDIDNLKLQKEEVEAIKFLPVEELKKDILDFNIRLNYCPHGDYGEYFKIIEYVENKCS